VGIPGGRLKSGYWQSVFRDHRISAMKVFVTVLALADRVYGMAIEPAAQ
jgi:hypothetical protein